MAICAVWHWAGDYASQDTPTGVLTTPVQGGIYRVTPNGSNPIILSLPRPNLPTLSVDGQWLYFQAGQTGQTCVFRCHLNGTGQQKIAPHAGLGPRWKEAFGFSLSANGEHIVYTVSDGQTGRVVVASSDGSQAKFVAPDLGYIYMPALNPEGTHVVFSGPATGYRLGLTNLMSGQTHILTSHHPHAYAPRFTQEGSSIIFVRRDGDIYRVEIENGLVQQLTQKNRYYEFHLSPKDHHGSTDGPAISPDGKRIAYIAMRNGIPNVWVMDINGKNQRQLTHQSTPCGRVQWQPNSTHIQFVSFVEHRPQLFIVSTNESNVHQATDFSGGVVAHT